MNIALIVHSYLPDVGGSQETTRGLAREFSKSAHKVKIVVLSPGLGKELKELKGGRFDSFKRFEVIEGIDVYRLRIPFLGFPREGLKCIVDTFRLFFSLPFVLIKLARILIDNKIEIINVQYAGINAFYIWVLSFFLRFKYILTLQGFNIQVLPFLKGIRGYIISSVFKAVLSRAHFVTGCSRYLLNDAIKRTPQIKNKSRVIPNGIDLEEFKHNGRALLDYPYILCLGRLQAPFKGFDLALRAFKNILESGYDIDLLLVGDGPNIFDYKELAKSLGIDRKVSFFGLANRIEVTYLFKNCEFFLMPSRVEPLGIVNLEAMACSKAVIASRTGGIPEVVDDNTTGLLVEPNNEKALREAMQKLLTDKNLRDRLGRNGRSKLEGGNFSWKVIADDYLKVFEGVLNGREAQI